MKRLLLTLALVAGCYQVNEPTPPIQFSLTTIDGQVLPRAPIGWPPEHAIASAGLNFGTIAGLSDGAQGIVAYTTTVAGQTTTTPYSFAVTGSILHINLCPIGALCTAVLTELVGPVTADALVLTYSIGGGANSVFRFSALRSD